MRSGDRIRLDVPGRRLDLLVEESELASRRAAPPPAPPDRGYKRLHVDRVLQADEGCDLDFLTRRPFVARTPS